MSSDVASSDRGRLTTGDIVLFSLLAGTAVTFIHGYYYGLNNHIEQLPQIFRVLDPSYITNDFEVNATAGYGPRAFYVYFMAWLGKVVPLPALFLVLTCLQNAAVAFVTALVARRLSGSNFAALFAASLAMSVESIHLGEAGYLRLPALIPASLVTGLALWSIWEGIRDRPIASALIAMPAALIHPMLGLEAGIVGVGASFLSRLIGIGGPRRWRPLLRAVAGAAILAAFGLSLWIGPQSKQLLTSRQLIDIYGWFRAPHHIIPSTFPLRDYLAAAAFLIAFATSWAWWYRRPSH